MQFGKRFLVLATVVSWAAVSSAGGKAPVHHAGPPDTVHLTVTADGRALVTEERTVTLPAGDVLVEAADIPARLEPRTVITEVVKGPEATILAQDYLFDLLDRDHLLQRCVGREVSWIQDDGSRITGVLLSVAGSPVFRVGDDVVFQVPGRLALPLDAADYRPSPALRWRVRATRRGERTLRLSYLTDGVTWGADYVLALDGEGDKGRLQGWLTVENRCGRTFRRARVRLLAGTLNRVAPGPRPLDGFAAERSLAAPAPGGPEAVAAGDHYLFPLPGTLELPDRSRRQFRLLDRGDLPVTRRLDVGLVMGQHGDRTVRRLPVAVTYLLRNEKEYGLGRPLPAGVVRVRQSDGATAVPLGEDRIAQVPVGETMELHTGSAFDLTTKAVMEDWERRDERTVRQRWRLELHNAGRRADTVRVTIRGTGRSTTVVHCDRRWQEVDATSFRVPVTVPAGGDATLRWTADLTR